MSKVVTLLNDIIKESGNTIYSIATKAGIERSYLSKILSRKRKMTFDRFLAVLDAVCESETKRAEIIEAYVYEMFGKEKFEMYCDYLSSDFVNDTFVKKTTITKLTTDFKVLDSKRSLFNFAEFFISDENDSKRIYTNFPIDELLSIACRKEECDFRCIINSDNKDKFVSVFDLIKLNLLCCIGYINEIDVGIEVKKTLYPYVIITDDCVLFASNSLNKGYYIKNVELADLYAKDFCKACKNMKVNSQIHDDILDIKKPIFKYLFNRKIHRVVTNNLSVVSFLTRKEWEELAILDLPDRGYLINTTYEYYKAFFENIESHHFITQFNGLTDFCDNGTVKEMPREFQKPLSIQTRIAILERLKSWLIEHPEKVTLNFFKNRDIDKFEIDLSIESSFDPNADYETTLVALSGNPKEKSYFPGNYIFVSTDKNAITEYNNFFDLLRISDKVMTVKETLAAIDDRILRMKYIADNINTAIEE